MSDGLITEDSGASDLRQVLSLKSFVPPSLQHTIMVSEELLGSVRKHMSTVRVPAHYDRVYKDECQFSFDTPLSANGLYINLNSWQAFGQEYVEIDSKRSGQQLYLHELWHKVGKYSEILAPLTHKRTHGLLQRKSCIYGSILQVPLSAKERQKHEQTPEKLAIGGDSGFQVDGPARSIDKHSELVLLGDIIRVPLPCLDLPEVIINAVDAIQVCQHVSDLKFLPLGSCMLLWLFFTTP